MREARMELSGRPGMSRRRFVQMAGGLIVATACGGRGTERGEPGDDAAPAPSSSIVPPSGQLSGDLRILQWSHFVPRHDQWFDDFATAWGEEVGVNVSVDHIDLAELGTRLSSEIAAGQGHDLVELLSPPSAFEPSVLDLTDLNEEARRRFGQQTELCTRSSFNPTTGKFYGFCHGWVPDPGDYRRSMWEQIDLPDGPSTYQELLEGGTRIRDEQGVHMGIGMSNEIDSNMAARAMIWSFGGSVQDADENVVLNSPETVEAVDYMARLFQATMTPEVFAWNAASNNQGLIAGEFSYILNSISAYRTAQQANPDVADDIFFTPALNGPAGSGLASQHVIPIYQQGDISGERGGGRLDAFAQGDDVGFEVVDVGEHPFQQEGVMIRNRPVSALRNAGSLARSFPRASSAKNLKVGLAATSARIMFRPDTPITSVAMVASFTPASSRALWIRLTSRDRSLMSVLR